MAVEGPSEMPIVHEPISRALHNLTDLGIVTTDVDLRVTGWNRWMEVHSGKAAATVVGMKLTDLYPELITRKHYQHYQQALQGRVVILAQRFHRYLLPMPHAVSSLATPLMQQSARIAPLVDELTNTVGTLTIIEDVSERVSYDNQIAKHASRQTAISALSQTALSGATLGNVYQDACRLVAVTLGCPLVGILETVHQSEQVILRSGFGFEETLRDQVFFSVTTDFARLASASALQAITLNHHDLKLTQSWRDLGVESGLCLALPAIGPSSELLAIFSTNARDFTEDEIDFVRTMAGIVGMAQDRHRLLEQLQSKIDELATADQRKDEFLAMLAHELRNPLAPITNAAELLRKGVDEATRNWATSVIERQLLQITRLVDDLLDVARITRGKVVLRKSIVDIATVVHRALETSHPLIESRGHDLQVTLPADPQLVECDVARLSQVISNLLNNAAKYTPNQGKIRLGVERSAGEIVISVSDSGVGIAEEMMPAIFELFTQINPSLDRKEGGLGIGLTLVRSLVKLHGGSVSVRSAGVNQGSEFTVRLPACDALPTEQDAFGSDSVATRPKRVLIVDDNEDAADLIKLLLNNFGHEAMCVYDGRSALAYAGQARPEVVILDLGLPGMSGYEVAAKLRELLGQSAVLVALTGYGQDDDRRRTSEAGFDYHLVKPIAAVELDTLFHKL